MDPHNLKFWLTNQMFGAAEAPLPIALAVLLTALIVWRVTRWRYLATVQRLRRTIEHRNRELAALRGGADTGSAVALPADEGAEAAARRKTVRKISNAIERITAAGRRPDEAEKAMPAVSLTLLAVRNAFDLPVPEPGPSAVESLETARRFLEHIRPPLRDGAIDEARASAAAFLRDEANRRSPATEFGATDTRQRSSAANE